MLNKTVTRRTFVTVISSLVVAVTLSILLVYLATDKDPNLVAGQQAGEELSPSDSNAVGDGPTTTLASSLTTAPTTTSASVSSTEKTTPSTPATPPKNSDKNHVVFIGDSLIAQTGTPEALVSKLAADGWQQISINAQGCRANHTAHPVCDAVTHFTTMLDAIETSTYDVYNSGGSVPGAHQDVLKSLFKDDPSTLSRVSENDLNESFRQADTIVVSLGTNDHGSAEEMEAGVRLTISAIKSINPNINIYWVKICAQGDKKGLGDIFNPSLEQLSQELAFDLIDWASQCQASHQFDGVHYNDQGVEAYTDALAAGVS